VVAQFGARIDLAFRRGEPGAAEDQAGAEAGEEDGLPGGLRAGAEHLQGGVECGAAGGGAQIAGGGGDQREGIHGDAGYLGQKVEQSRVGLVGGEGADGGAWDGAELFEGGDYFFEARDCGAGEGFAFEDDGEAAVGFAFDFDGVGILIGAAEEEIANAVGKAGGFC
jgi:hypothetical protein